MDNRCNNEWRGGITMKHYFYLVMNNRTYQAFYEHDYFRSVEEIKERMTKEQELIKVWEVKGEVEL